MSLLRVSGLAALAWTLLLPFPPPSAACTAADVARWFVAFKPDTFPVPPPSPLVRFPSSRSSYLPGGRTDKPAGRYRTEGEDPPSESEQAGPRPASKEKRADPAPRLAQLREILSDWLAYDDALTAKQAEIPKDHAELREWLETFPFPKRKADAERIPERRIWDLEQALARFERFSEWRASRKYEEHLVVAAKAFLYMPTFRTADGKGFGKGSFWVRHLAAEWSITEDEALRRVNEEWEKANRDRILLEENARRLAEKALLRGGITGARVLMRELVAFLIANEKVEGAKQDLEESVLEILQALEAQNVVPCTIEALETDKPEIRDYLRAMIRELAKDARRPAPDPTADREELIAWYEKRWGPWPLGPAPTLEGLDLSEVALLPAPKR